MKVVYVAHPLNAPTSEEREANRRSAARWAAWLAKTFNVAVVCDWIVLSSVWSEEEGRALGLEIDKALIARCDGLFLCGPLVSSGMAVERDHAYAIGKQVFDLTKFELATLGRTTWPAIDALTQWIAALPESA